MHCKLLGVYLLLKGLSVVDDLVSIDQVLLQFMGKHSFQRSHLISVAHLLDHVGHFVVEFSRFDEPDCGLSGLVSSKDNICLFACDHCIFIRVDDNGMGNK